MSADPFLPYVSRVPLSWQDTEGPVAHWLDGTVLFVDVAGFTALSERLSVLGKAGAEELTDLLDGAFARLLAAAYEEGGSLLSFGGDALLLFFTGPDHERRTARAAGVIRRKPAELGALATSVGPVRLRLSMGAHSGRFVFLVTGGDSRVVMLLGRDATRVVRLEQRASAGQVLLGPSLAAAVPESAGPVEDGAALLLRTPRAAQGDRTHTVGEPATQPWRFLSPALREHIGGQPSSEHRRVAVGFIQLRGTDDLIDRDPGAAFEAIDAIVVRTQEAAADYGVSLLASDVDADGAKLILVGGAPRATEHEEERLLRTCRAVLDVPTPLSVRSGVTAGHVFVGDVGPSYRRAYTVMGDRVNLAARLMASAEPGELRTLPSVLAGSHTAFETRAVEPLRLKGIKDPVEAVVVGSPVRQVHRRAGTLTGREDALDALLTAARRGSCSVEIVADPGIGKSALVSAFLDEVGLPSMRVTAEPYESAAPYSVVRRILRELLRVDAETDGATVTAHAVAALGALSRQDLGLVLVAADGDHDPEHADFAVEDDLFHQRLARAVLQALDQLVPGQAVLVVEDTHVSDRQSADLLASVVDRLEGRPWTLVTSRRPTGPADRDARMARSSLLLLEPLSEDATRDLAYALTEHTPMPTARLNELIARSGGNPLFLGELVRVATLPGALPESLEAVVQARIDGLPTYLRDLLRQAAVLGAVFDLDLLGEVAGFVPDREEWRLLSGLLQRTGSRASFVSEIYRDVAYDSLLFKRRRDLHRAAGRALAARGSNDVEVLALHAAEAHDDELTWQYAVDAGHRAAGRGAHDAAATAFQRALLAHGRSALGPPEETLQVHADLGLSQIRGGAAHEAVRTLRRARSLSPRGAKGDPGLCHLEALARVELGKHASARQWLSAGLRALGPEDPPAVHARLLELQAGTQLRQGRYESTLRTCRALLDLTASQQSPEALRSQAHAHYLTHLVMVMTGDERRRDNRTEALRIYEELQDVPGLAKVLNNLGSDAYYEGRWTEAVELLERSRQYEEVDGNDVGAGLSDINIAEILLEQGRFEEARSRCERALRTFLACAFPIGIAETYGHLGRIEARLGRFDAAREALGRARATIAEMGAEGMVADALLREAELAVLRGHADEAERLLDQLDRESGLRKETELSALRLRAFVAASRGRPEAATELLELCVARADAGVPLAGALARHALGMAHAAAGRAVTAERHLLAATDALRQLGVQQFRDPLAGDDLIVIALPPQVLRRETRASVAV